MTDDLPDDLRSVKTGIEFLDEYLDMPRIDLTEFIEEQVRLLNKDREIPIVIGPKPSK